MYSDSCVCVCVRVNVRYIRDGKDKAMEECENQVASLTTQMEVKSRDRKELDESIATLNKELANYKVRST